MNVRTVSPLAVPEGVSFRPICAALGDSGEVHVGGMEISGEHSLAACIRGSRYQRLSHDLISRWSNVYQISASGIALVAETDGSGRNGDLYRWSSGDLTRLLPLEHDAVAFASGLNEAGAAFGVSGAYRGSELFGTPAYWEPGEERPTPMSLAGPVDAARVDQCNEKLAFGAAIDLDGNPMVGFWGYGFGDLFAAWAVQAPAFVVDVDEGVNALLLGQPQKGGIYLYVMHLTGEMQKREVDIRPPRQAQAFDQARIGCITLLHNGQSLVVVNGVQGGVMAPSLYLGESGEQYDEPVSLLDLCEPPEGSSFSSVLAAFSNGMLVVETVKDEALGVAVVELED